MGQKQNKKGTSLIPQFVADKEKKITYLNKNLALMDGWTNPDNKSNVFLSLRFVQHKQQCFSDWSKQEMEIFWNFNDKIHEVTWEQIYQQSGKGENKAGFGVTTIDRAKYKNDFLKNIDPLTNIIEMRLNSTIRVHGFRDRPFYYILFLDKNHEICG